MKTITLLAACALLENCSAVIWDDTYVSYPSIADLTGEDENEFLYLSVDNSNVKFAEGENRTIKVVGSSMFLVDTDGDECQITLLNPVNLEKCGL